MHITETIFVTRIKGDYYLDGEDVPAYMKYTYYRPSDGAVFRGILQIYYIRAEVIDDVVWWHGFYDGTLTFQFYTY
ncbi:hypothetical protein TXYLGN1_10530 [Tepidimicrobium xylanilyticum]